MRRLRVYYDYFARREETLYVCFIVHLMDRCDFTSLSIIFQSYQDYRRVIIQVVCNGTLPSAGIEPGTAGAAGQR